MIPMFALQRFALTIILAGVIVLSIVACDHGRQEAGERQFIEERIVPAIEEFYKDMGRYPTAEEGFSALFANPDPDSPSWRGPYLREITTVPMDPWGNPYIYIAHEGANFRYKVLSMGPDGVISDDDSVHTRR